MGGPTGFGFSPKCCFLCFCFSPQDFSTEVITLKRGWGGKIKKRKSGVISFFCSRDEGIRTLDLCNVTAAL